jgi:hypothetical protein
MNNQAWARIPHNQARKFWDSPPRLIASGDRRTSFDQDVDAQQA